MESLIWVLLTLVVFLLVLLLLGLFVSRPKLTELTRLLRALAEVLRSLRPRHEAKSRSLRSKNAERLAPGRPSVAHSTTSSGGASGSRGRHR